MRIARLIATLSFLAATAPAQDAADLTNEVREMRKLLEQQSRQIEILTQQVSKLIEAKPAMNGAAAAGAAPSASAGQEEFSTENAPKADPAHPRHVVVKGETLTSIAKHYNVPLAELMKANKGLDERKLQIGQSISLPPPPQATAAPTSETKPNP